MGSSLHCSFFKWRYFFHQNSIYNVFIWTKHFLQTNFFPKSKVYKDFFNPLSHHSRNYLSYSRTEATLSKSYKKGTKAVKHKKIGHDSLPKKTFSLSPQTYFFCKPTISMPSLSKTMISKKKKNRKKKKDCTVFFTMT